MTFAKIGKKEGKKDLALLEREIAHRRIHESLEISISTCAYPCQSDLVCSYVCMCERHTHIRTHIRTHTHIRISATSRNYSRVASAVLSVYRKHTIADNRRTHTNDVFTLVCVCMCVCCARM